ncbi:DUF4435 domain-containing protein [Geomonas nitrogeniifigens]|uniref:DUF4435 domain-containing protein n=1 Tax=Geomonas diazotrophica TaxID=2843197 RepID=A0ABX8JNI2_9BACT|nr:DUF4435 domain-containing protein [Geomonas nitrogeniifigens]QWV98651.1 DUF4435 domain-containing protein [Geomonas nitrogeniifigens]
MSEVPFLQTLALALQSQTVTLHKFLLNLRKDTKIVHSFFEGKTDESFYGSFLRNAKEAQYDLTTYICGNKKSVYYYFDSLKNKNIGSNILLFFVDKDLDDIVPTIWPSDFRVYTTDHYSVENYIVTELMFEQVWGEIFRQGSGTEASKVILSKFSKCLQDFHEFMLMVMAWILYHRRNVEQRTDLKMHLDQVDLLKLYKIDKELNFVLLCTDKDIVEKLSLQTGCSTQITQWDKYKNSLISELKLHPLKNIVRGHFEMQFFIYFITEAKDALVKALGKPVKMHLTLTDANAIDVLGPRVQLPKSLEIFLSNNLTSQLQLGM